MKFQILVALSACSFAQSTPDAPVLGPRTPPVRAMQNLAKDLPDFALPPAVHPATYTVFTPLRQTFDMLPEMDPGHDESERIAVHTCSFGQCVGLPLRKASDLPERDSGAEADDEREVATLTKSTQLDRSDASPTFVGDLSVSDENRTILSMLQKGVRTPTLGPKAAIGKSSVLRRIAPQVFELERDALEEGEGNLILNP